MLTQRLQEGAASFPARRPAAGFSVFGVVWKGPLFWEGPSSHSREARLLQEPLSRKSLVV